jgi:hypothetical protein
MMSSAHFDLQSTGIDIGTGDVTLLLKKTGVSPGKYNAFTVDAYGRILTAWTESNSGSGGSTSASIQNQHASQQTGSFWISGPAKIDGTLQVANLTVGNNLSVSNLQLQSPLSSSFGGSGVSVASASTFFAGPPYGQGSGSPAFRSITESDLPEISFSKVYDTPTTLAGYGITDAFSETSANQVFVKNQYVYSQTGGLWMSGILKSSDGLVLELNNAATSTSNKLYNVGGSLYWNGSPVAADTTINAELPLFFSSNQRKLRLQYSATNFKLTSQGVLETIQDINSTASPTFSSLVLTSQNSIKTTASAFQVQSDYATSDPSSASDFRLSAGDLATYTSWTPAGVDSALSKKVFEFASVSGSDTGHLQLVRNSVDITKTTISLYVDGFIETIQKNGHASSAGGIKTGGSVRIDNAGQSFFKLSTIGNPNVQASASTQLSVSSLSIDEWGLIRLETLGHDKGSATKYVTPNATWLFGARDDLAFGTPASSWFIGNETSNSLYGNSFTTWINTQVSVAKSIEIQSYNEQAPSNKLYNLNGTLFWNGIALSNDDDVYEPKWPNGSSSQYYRGDRTLQSLNTDAVPEAASNQYFTQARARSSIRSIGNTSLSYDSVSGSLSLSDTPSFNSLTILNTPFASTDAATVGFVKLNAAATPNGRDTFVVTDASRKDYTLSNLPISNSTVRVLLNGLEGIQGPSEDFTITGLTVSFNASVTLTATDKITVIYTF